MKTSCLLRGTPLFHSLCPSSFLFPSLFSLPCFFSFLLLLFLLPCLSFTPLLALSPSLSLSPSFLAEPYCIQIQQSPYKAAQLNMSHVIYPQQSCKLTFRRRRGEEERRGGERWRGESGGSTGELHSNFCHQPLPSNFISCGCVCLHVFVC